MAHESFIGNYLSLDCGAVLGTFQGEVSSVSKSGQTISLKNAFRNGVKYDVPEVTMRASDIQDLKILKTSADLKKEAERNREIFKAVAKTKKEGDGVNQAKNKENNKVNGELSKSSLTATRRTTNTDRSQSKSPLGKPSTTDSNKTQKDNGGENKNFNNLNHSQRSAFHSPNRPQQNGNGGSGGEGCSGGEKVKTGKPKRSASFNVPHGKGTGQDGGSGGSKSGRPAFHRVSSVDGLSRRGGGDVSKDEDDARQADNRSRRKTYSGCPEGEGGHVSRSSPVKINTNGRKHNRGGFNARNAECFSAPVETFLNDDFDFDSNFALFDKENFYQELDAMGEENRPKSAKRQGPRNLRFDENILERRESEEGKRIICPNATEKWYHTDTDMHIPAISPELKARLMSSAQNLGITSERRIETVGLCSSQLVLQLIDKQRRINSKRTSAVPSVVVLCGPHLQGAQGVSCARHLTHHGVTVTLFVPNFVKMLDELQQEIHLFDATDGVKLQSYKDLPKSSELTDLVICALDTPNDSITPDQGWYRAILKWLEDTNKAPTLCLDPSNTQMFSSRWCAAVGLPLSYEDKKVGELYLCNAGLPKKAFEALGIRYMSPFSRGLFVQLDNS